VVAIMVSAVAEALALVALILVVLGTVSIIMGFSCQWPAAPPCGATFFVGGCLPAGLARIAWLLQKVHAAPPPKEPTGREKRDRHLRCAPEPVPVFPRQALRDLLGEVGVVSLPQGRDVGGEQVDLAADVLGLPRPQAADAEV